MGGIQKIALFGKIPSQYFGKNNSNKKEKQQSTITLRHELLFAKTMKRYNETGSHEDRKGRPS
jgi:hypothetical protein